MNDPIKTLLSSDEPCIRYRTMVDLDDVPKDSPEARREQELIRSSKRVKALLSTRDRSGKMANHVYAKFTGAHWVLADLAEIGYPPGDTSLLPVRDQVYDCWLSPEHTKNRIVEKESAKYKSQPGVPIIDGRARRCGSQEGNALYATLALGIADDRADRLAENLIRWQWPDGGWNCDRKWSAKTSSFHETLLPLRGLALHAKLSGSKASAKAAAKAAEFFLKRKLFRKLSDGSAIREDFLKLRYPHYWHYDILIALKVMVEAGFIKDHRCQEALDVLASKRLPDGGWRAEGKHYRVSDQPVNGGSLADWGQVSRKKIMNEFVSLDALYILKEAGRV